MIRLKYRFNLDHKMTNRHVQLFLCIVCISWLNGGIAGQGNLINGPVFIICFAMWFLLAMYTSAWRLKISNVWMWVYAILLCIYNIISEGLNNSFFAAVYLLCISIFFDYYAKEEFQWERKVILSFFYLENFLFAVRTIYVCNIDPLFVRKLTGGVEIGDKISELFVGGFGNIYVYSMLAVYVILISCKLKHKFGAYVAAAVFISCVYFANFTTALFVMCGYLVLLMVLKTPRKILTVIGIVIMAIPVVGPFIANGTLYLAKSGWLSDFLSNKLIDLNNVITGTGKGNQYNTMYSRIEFQKDAASVFWNHPILGVYGMSWHEKDLAKIHNHNVWLDLLANFGIIRSTPFFMALVTFYQKNKKWFMNWKISPLSHMLTMWVIYGFFNPVNQLPEQVFLLFIVPLSGVYFHVKERENI